MAAVDLAGIAEPHRSAVTAIVYLVRQGVHGCASAPDDGSNPRGGW
jgi:hypothetical protein